MNLEGQTAGVTGSGIGLAGAVELALDGARLAISGRDAAKLELAGEQAVAAALLLLLLLLAMLSGCASRGPPTGRDGAEANPPPNLAQRPDAAPRLEPIRIGGPNKPYDVGGLSYRPLTEDLPFQERGLASWYGSRFHGLPTASGETYDMYAMTAAHPTLPIPSYARIRNPANGRQVIVRINDRGPFHPGRIVDLSYTAALKLDLLGGTRPVELERITFDDIRTGAWQQGPAGSAAPSSPLAAGGRAEAMAPAGMPMPAPTLRAAADVRPGASGPEAARPADGAAAAVADSRPAASSPTTAAVPVEPSPAAAARAPAATALPPAATVATALPTAGGAAPPAAVALPPAGAAPPPASGGATGAWWVQLGAFRQQDGAAAFRERVGAQVDGLLPLLTVVADAALFKLQAGPYANREDARDAASRLRGLLQLVPMVVERR